MQTRSVNRVVETKQETSSSDLVQTMLTKAEDEREAKLQKIVDQIILLLVSASDQYTIFQEKYNGHQRYENVVKSLFEKNISERMAEMESRKEDGSDHGCFSSDSEQPESAIKVTIYIKVENHQGTT